MTHVLLRDGEKAPVKNETAMVIGALIVFLGAGALAFSILSNVLTPMRFGGPYSLAWSSDPLVLLTELAVAAGAVLVAVVATLRMRAQSASLGAIAGWVGVGILALGAVSIAAGWIGMRVPTPYGVNDLERREWFYVLAGVAAIPAGLVVAVIGFMAMSASSTSSLVEYLVANRGATTWIVAVPDSATAARMQAATGGPVLSLTGDAGGSGNPLTVQQMESCVASGQLKFAILDPLVAGQPVPPVYAWIRANGDAIRIGATTVYDLSGAAY